MRTTERITTAAAALLLCALSCGQLFRATAQERRPPVRHDAARLRRDLAAALGGEFEIVRDELTRRSTYYGGGAYWLAHVRPKRNGHFTLKYTYRYDDPSNKNDPLYTHVEHDLSFGVGPRGCPREPQYMAAYFHPCLGDTIILPFVLDAYKSVFTEHTFKFTINSITTQGEATRREDREERQRQDAALNRDAVSNPLAEHLKYVGRSVGVRPHRAPGFTADFYVTLEALKPGRFNVSVSGLAPDASPQPGTWRGGGSIPVIVVERGTPVTWLASRESVRGYSERFSSNSGNNYMTTPVIMQPGERLTLRYFSYSRRGPGVEGDLAAEELGRRVVPVITRLPFSVERETEFNEWIIDHLPATP